MRECPGRECPGREETSGKWKESTCEADRGVGRTGEVLMSMTAGEDGAEDVQDDVLEDESVPPLND